MELIVTLCVNLLIPFVMICEGESFRKKKAYEKINSVSGYRTSMSMQNQDTWEFVHKLCGTIWLICGLIALPVTAIFMFSAAGRYEGSLGAMNVLICGVQIILLAGTILPVEIVLRVVFDKNGERRN